MTESRKDEPSETLEQPVSLQEEDTHALCPLLPTRLKYTCTGTCRGCLNREGKEVQFVSKRRFGSPGYDF